MNYWEEREAGERYKAKGQQEPRPIFLPFPSLLPTVLDAKRTALFLALAASFSKSQWFPLFHFPPVKTDVLIHQAVLKGFYTGEERWWWISPSIQVLKDIFWMTFRREGLR